MSGHMPIELRATIARNIRGCRLSKFPDRGGQKNCAEAFSKYAGRNVSPQQWSPWERGQRTPDEMRLEMIAKFFDKTVEWMRTDHRNEPSAGSVSPSCPDNYEYEFICEAIKIAAKSKAFAPVYWQKWGIPPAHPQYHPREKANHEAIGHCFRNVVSAFRVAFTV